MFFVTKIVDSCMKFLLQLDEMNIDPEINHSTVKILKFGTPQTIAITVLEIEKFVVTLH